MWTNWPKRLFWNLLVGLPLPALDLVDFAMRCPVSLKLNKLENVVRLNENEPGGKQARFFRKTKHGKQILRDAMCTHIFRDYGETTKLVGEHLSGERNHCLSIWSLLSIKEWCRQNL